MRTETRSPSLSNLQRWMRGVLTHPRGVASALRRDRRCLHVIGETPTVGREERLAIYGNGYFGRIIECLESNFSSVAHAAGSDDFADLARAYLIRYPSTFKSIDDIGSHMAAFLKRHSLTRRHRFLPDLAELEWNTHESFFADDVPPFDPASIRNASPAVWRSARLTLDPSVRLLSLRWPVDDLWRDDGNWKKQRLARLRPLPVNVLVHRQEDKLVRCPRMDVAPFALLERLHRGQTLGTALSSVRTRKVLPIEEWFQEWVRWGVVRKVTFA